MEGNRAICCLPRMTPKDTCHKCEEYLVHETLRLTDSYQGTMVSIDELDYYVYSISYQRRGGRVQATSKS